MPPSQEAQRKAFTFLRQRFQNQQPFTEADFQAATGWDDGTFKTHLSKQFRDLLEPVGRGLYRVTETFAAYGTWRRFRTIVSQVRRLVTEYRESRFPSVVVYEFYMPLKHETALKNTLDSLFYRDVIEARLRAVGVGELRKGVSAQASESDEDLMARIMAFVDAKFGGYSIYHVNGRFRAGSLRTIADAAERQATGKRYLVDETTAVARFIFPCDAVENRDIEFLFATLFIKSITRLVAGEDVIWMVEFGVNNRVHVWEAADVDQGEDWQSRRTADRTRSGVRSVRADRSGRRRARGASVVGGDIDVLPENVWSAPPFARRRPDVLAESALRQCIRPTGGARAPGLDGIRAHRSS